MVGPLTYWDYTTVGTRVGSGTQVILSQALYIYARNTTIDLYFSNSPTGASVPIVMTGTTMSMKFYPTNAPSQQITFEACGEGCTLPFLSYVGGSAEVTGAGGQVVTFSVANSGAAPLTFDVINILSMTWEEQPLGTCWECGTAYLSTFESGGQQYWSYTNEGNGERAISGVPLQLRSTLYLPEGNTSIVLTFNNQLTGAGADIKMSRITFDIQFNSTCTALGTPQHATFTTIGDECSVCGITYLSRSVTGNEMVLGLTNNGVTCNVIQVKIISDTTAYVYRIRDNLSTKVSATGQSELVSTVAPGSFIILDSPIVLTQLDATIDQILFMDATNSPINVEGHMEGIYLKMDCCDCGPTQYIPFPVIP